MLKTWLTPLPAALLFMGLLWAVHLRRRDAGLVDVGWALCLGGLAITLAAVGSAPTLRRVLLAVLVGAWSLRLASHLLFDRVLKGGEDPRYERLREHWGRRANAAFLPFFLGQGLFAALLSYPFLVIAHNPRPGLAPLEAVGLVLFVGSLVGQALADRQLARFRGDPTTQGAVCRRGLWAWSRHPNYFFEWLMWVAYALAALAAPHGVPALLAPAIMLLMVLRVSGIPWTEAQALRSRGEAYRRYRREVSAFFPWPPQEVSGS